jgi:hypothetical protein
MQVERGSKPRFWAITAAVACILAFVTLTHSTWAQEPEGPDYCSWMKQVWINGVGPALITTPRSFGVVVSDTVHIRDTIFCDFNYEWDLNEHWDPDLLSFTDPGYQTEDGIVDDYPPGSLHWWGGESSGVPVQLDKYLHVDTVGWATTEISETVQFSIQGGPPYQYIEKPFYLQELVEGGDAPSSYNHTSSPMTTTTFITGALATFPVVWDWDGTMDPAPPSYGFCHYSKLEPSFLGTAPSYELDADLTPDDDGNTNIDPPNNSPDRDNADDGVSFPSVLPNCGTATVNVVGENNLGANLYLNAWADWNRDGDWDDTSLCECETSEWIIQGYTVSPGGAFDLDIPITPCHPITDRTEPLWVRFTLSEMNPLSGEPWIYGGQPNPASTFCFDEGETEDYYVEPVFLDECEWDKHVYVNDELAGDWDEGPFAVAVSDTITITDSLICNFEYSWNLHEEWDSSHLHLVDWEESQSPECWYSGEFDWSGGPVPPGTRVTLTKTLHVDSPGFSQTAITESVSFTPEGLVAPMEKQVDLVELVEGGDAPSSHYHGGPAPPMETYVGSGVEAQFPVVWDWDGTLGPGPVTGYYGFCHYSGSTTYLGSLPTYELDADLMPDRDLVTNIEPGTNTPDRDLSDDGVTIPGLPACIATTLRFEGYNGSGSILYLNVWADWNRDGDWEDGTQCDCGDDEWAIQDHIVQPCPIDESVDIIPCHLGDPAEPLWIRVTLTKVPLAPLGEPWIYGGQPHPAPNGCFELGETQDFLFQQKLFREPLLMSNY